MTRPCCASIIKSSHSRQAYLVIIPEYFPILKHCNENRSVRKSSLTRLLNRLYCNLKVAGFSHTSMSLSVSRCLWGETLNLQHVAKIRLQSASRPLMTWSRFVVVNFSFLHLNQRSVRFCLMRQICHFVLYKFKKNLNLTSLQSEWNFPSLLCAGRKLCLDQL